MIPQFESVLLSVKAISWPFSLSFSELTHLYSNLIREGPNIISELVERFPCHAGQVASWILNVIKGWKRLTPWDQPLETKLWSLLKLTAFGKALKHLLAVFKQNLGLYKDKKIGNMKIFPWVSAINKYIECSIVSHWRLWSHLYHLSLNNKKTFMLKTKRSTPGVTAPPKIKRKKGRFFQRLLGK